MERSLAKQLFTTPRLAEQSCCTIGLAVGASSNTDGASVVGIDTGLGLGTGTATGVTDGVTAVGTGAEELVGKAAGAEVGKLQSRVQLSPAAGNRHSR